MKAVLNVLLERYQSRREDGNDVEDKGELSTNAEVKRLMFPTSRLNNKKEKNGGDVGEQAFDDLDAMMLGGSGDSAVSVLRRRRRRVTPSTSSRAKSDTSIIRRRSKRRR